MQYFQKLLMANSCLHAKNSSKEKKVMQLLYGSPKFYEKAKLINDPKLMIDVYTLEEINFLYANFIRLIS